MMKQFVKFFLIFLFIFVYMSHASILWLFTRGDWALRAKLIHLISTYARLGLSIMNLQVQVKGPKELLTANTYLIASNHMSYLDILIHSSVISGCFVTSQEIREVPLLGHICRLAGCLFVERRNKENIHNEIQELTDALGRGLNVIFYPEATSTNGEEIFRFRKPLFYAATNAKVPVLPICLNYLSIDGVSVTRANRDLLCWYGDMSFAPHLWKVMKAKKIVVEIEILKPISELPKDPQVLALQTQGQIERAFRPVQFN